MVYVLQHIYSYTTSGARNFEELPHSKESHHETHLHAGDAQYFTNENASLADDVTHQRLRYGDLHSSKKNGIGNRNESENEKKFGKSKP